ncbi:hypothetical protein HK405_013992 [Cladochytrium tenue]|nr:hypothetical protein HK405_013992 [Cladochytrium tenue]
MCGGTAIRHKTRNPNPEYKSEPEPDPQVAQEEPARNQRLGLRIMSSRLGTTVLLLEAGYTVRATVRNLSKGQYVRDMLREAGLANPDTAALSFFIADLDNDEGWVDAVTGCDYVLHVASPFPFQAPADEDEIIRPAREGTLRILRAARDAKVKRVVVTSSVGAVAYEHEEDTATYDETAWSVLPKMSKAQAYMKSKTLAERAAWDFIESESGGLELAVINPVGCAFHSDRAFMRFLAVIAAEKEIRGLTNFGLIARQTPCSIFGQFWGNEINTSIEIIRMMLSGSMPAYPKIYSGLVDVRDVASLHLLAMTHEKAKNHVFSQVLKARLPAAAAQRIWTSDLPDIVVRIAALVLPMLSGLVSELGKRHDVTSAKARELLEWKPRSNEEALVAAAECLIAKNLVDKKA